MPRHLGLTVLMTLLVGCSTSEPQTVPSDLAESGEPKPNILATPTPPVDNSPPPVTPESAVQSAIAEQFKVAPHTIEMNKPLGGKPLNADDQDIDELVMEIEERLNLTIPESALGDTPLQLSPAQMVSIVRDVQTAAPVTPSPETTPDTSSTESPGPRPSTP